MNRNISKLVGDEKGISMIMTFFIMIIALSVVLSISILLYSEVKVIRNIGNSIVSFYAADSGIDKVLYYDRQVLPSNGVSCTSNETCKDFTDYTSCNNGLCTISPSLSSRGLCSIFSSCTNDEHPGDPIEHSIYCNAFSGSPTSPDDPEGDYCGGISDPYNCADCTIKFSTTFDNRIYYVEATVDPDNNYYLKVESNGAFADTGRQIQIIIGQ